MVTILHKYQQYANDVYEFVCDSASELTNINSTIVALIGHLPGVHSNVLVVETGKRYYLDNSGHWEEGVEPGGAQPQLFAPVVTQGTNTVSWANDSRNGGFSVTLTATVGGNTVTSPLTITEAMHGKTLSVVASATNFQDATSSEVLAYYYSISASVTNGTATGDTLIEKGGTATFTIVASSGYELPAQADITIINATITSYDTTTGVGTIANPTGNVTITATCPQSQPIDNAVTLTASGDWTHQSEGEIVIRDTNNNDIVWSQSPANKSAYPITLYLPDGTYSVIPEGPATMGIFISTNDFSGDYYLGFYINNNGSIDIRVDDFDD